MGRPGGWSGIMNKPRCMQRFLKSFWAMCLAVSGRSLKQGSAKGEGG
jgi:hypothetical protein